ncbi:unnamed protein product [Moneuplotes crassus]|uniref:Uncharacterized protein n=1 Tax=Euplotes crassus TaxID=5936 RepID=A0AAD1Y4U4_EUPCR|nr:unnamed protein product [Moneuplotes crassus]
MLSTDGKIYISVRSSSPQLCEFLVLIVSPFLRKYRELLLNMNYYKAGDY